MVLRKDLSPLDTLKAYFHAYYVKALFFLGGIKFAEYLEEAHWMGVVAKWRAQSEYDHYRYHVL